MRYFLAKTDPETYSIEQLEKEKRTAWDGVNNPQAVRAIREMQPGDKVFIYHSGGNSAIVDAFEAMGVAPNGKLPPEKHQDFFAFISQRAAQYLSRSPRPQNLMP